MAPGQGVPEPRDINRPSMTGPGSPGAQEETLLKRNALFWISWLYAQGLIVIVLIVFLVETIAREASEVSAWLEGPLGGGGTTGWRPVIGVAFVLVAPLIVGWLTGIFLRLFRKDRDVQALMQWERHLTRKLTAGRSLGDRVALLKSPSADVRTLVVVGPTFLDPESGQKLATVYLPDTPDISKGTIRVVSLNELSMTDWDLDDLFNCHLSWGLAVPPTPPDEETSGS